MKGKITFNPYEIELYPRFCVMMEADLSIFDKIDVHITLSIAISSGT